MLEKSTTKKPTEEAFSVPFLDLKKIYRTDEQEYLDLVKNILGEAQFIGGSEVERFEKGFASWVGASAGVVGCGNGTDAIFLAATALELPKGSEAILPAMTYVATAEALVHAGFKLRLVDVEEGSWLMDVNQLSDALTETTSLIVPVHLYGQMAEMDRIAEIAESKMLAILEDAAQAQGARWKNQPVGYWGDVATYSFFPGKNLGAMGDAGGILSQDPRLLEKLRRLVNHGVLKKFDHEVVGYNSRLDNLQAGFLNIKLKSLDTWNARRRQIANIYLADLKDVSECQLPLIKKDSLAVFHQFVISVPDREDLRQFLADRNIQTGIHYPKAIHQQVAFKDLVNKGSFPVAEKLAAHTLSLPICPTLSDRQVEYVVESIGEYFNG